MDKDEAQQERKIEVSALPAAWVYPEFWTALKIVQCSTAYSSDGKALNSDGVEREPLYTSPPKRHWVGLTDDEIWQQWSSPKDSAVDFARAIEAKLKEKNT